MRAAVLPWLFAIAVAAWNARDAARHASDLANDPTTGAMALLLARGVAAGFEAFALGQAVWRWRRGERTSPRLRTLVLALPALAVVAASLARFALGADGEAQAQRSVFFAVLLSGTGWLLVRTPRAPTPRVRRYELVLFNVLATCILLEASLALLARIAPSPLLFAPALEARLAAVRPAPFSRWFGGKLNAGGYHDEAFFTASEEDFVAAVIADSFGIGVVPYAENFVTIAEQRLRERWADRYARVALHNFGVPAIGLEEYAHLLETEVEATNPTRVVLCVFVGNDITSDTAFGASGPGRFTLQEWLIVELPRRLLARQNAPEYVAALAAPRAPQGERIASPPAFAPEAYLALEARRLDVTDHSDRRVARRYERFLVGLDWFHDTLGERLLVLVFPDEFQIDDALWEDALARQDDPTAHERELPQQRIRAWAQARGVPLLDTTDALRAAHPGGAVYAPRNTHLNARGNQIVGALLADALAGAGSR